MEGNRPDAKTLIIIPTHKESDNIYNLAKRCLLFGDVIVIDNSPMGDKTEATAKSAGARTIRLPENVKIAGQVSSGLMFAIRHNYDWAITIDAGESHEIGDVLPCPNCDVVLGVRFGYPHLLRNKIPYRYVISRIGTLLFNITWESKLRDVTSGHRAFSVEFLRRFDIGNYKSSHFDFHTETASKLMAYQARIKEVPISYKYGTSTFRPKYLFWAFVWLVYWRTKSFLS